MVNRSQEIQPRLQRRIVVALAPHDAPVVEALQQRGFQVISAPPERIDEVAIAERARAILADADLPGVIVAVTRMRQGNRASASIPVVLLGAAQSPAERRAAGGTIHPAVKARPDAFFARPIAPIELLRQIDSLLENTVGTLRAPEKTNTRRPSRPPPSNSRMTPVPRPSGTSPAVQPFHAQKTPVPIRPTGVSSTMVPAAIAPSTVSSTAVSSSSLPAVAQSVTPPGEGTAPGAAFSAWMAAVPRPASDMPSPWTPPELSGTLRATLRAAIAELGGDAAHFDLPPRNEDSLDDLVPPELLEPLDGALEDYVDTREPPRNSGVPTATTNPGVTGRRTPSTRATSQTHALSPLMLDGDPQLGGALGRFGVARLLSAAARGRNSGVLSLRTGDATWRLAMHGGHLLSIRGSRPEDHIGPLLARLGFVPREAARFAEVPLDMGPRGAAMLAARGYIAPDALSPTLARAAQEAIFDLLCIERFDWELRPLESSLGIPLPARSIDAILVLGARARIEPALAYATLGGDGTRLTLRGDVAALQPLPLTEPERAAAAMARGIPVATLMQTHGDTVLPALLALEWLQIVRAESPSRDLEPDQVPLGPERTRVRALLEASERRDLLVLLGLSPWATRGAALAALDARRDEVDLLRTRYALSEGLQPIYAALDDAAQLLQDPAAWDRYAAALRMAMRDER